MVFFPAMMTFDLNMETSHLTLLHLGRPKLYIILSFLSAIGLKVSGESMMNKTQVVRY